MPRASTPKPVLVLGASGKTGRRVAERLRARGVPVRPGSRSADPSFDWRDPATWRPALDGASAAYLSYFPDLARAAIMKRILVCLLLAAALAAPSLALASGGAASLRTTMTGTMTVRISGARVCWTFGRLHGIDKPRAAVIKKGIPGEFGPVIVQLGKRYRASGCATTTTGTAQQLALSPRAFYVTVNTRRFPLGAVRGQLRKT